MNKSELRKTVGSNVHKERMRKNLTLDDLASLMGIASQAAGLFEKGKRGTSVLTLYKLAEAFEVPIDTFFQPDSEELRMAEDRPLTRSNKVTRIMTLVHDLPEAELDYAIESVVNLRKLTREMKSSDDGYDGFDDDEDEF